MKVNERIIQNWLWRYHRNSSELVMPNYTPSDWWECDLMIVTKSLMWHEYEIKLSKDDFYKDKSKAHTKFKVHERDGKLQFGRVIEATKHEQLAGASTLGPNCFWFVMPEGLVPVEEVPKWAGIKFIVPRGKWLTFNPIRPAPRLHKNHIDQKVLDHARSMCYWRYWKERCRL